jgi:hypothetical protein
VTNSLATLPDSLPDNVRTALTDFLSSAQRAFADDLRAAILFGSAADATLRKSSDVNLLLVLSRYAPERGQLLRNDLATAQAAILLRVMFLGQDEIPAACEAFAQKFSDILRRRVVLLGNDPFVGVTIPHAAQVRRLRQVLLNLLLRLRDIHASQAGASRVALSRMAESTGALRPSAMLLLQLEGRPTPQSPKQALLEVAEQVSPGNFSTELNMLSQLRETATLPAQDAEQVMVAMMELAAAMHTRAAAIGE